MRLTNKQKQTNGNIIFSPTSEKHQKHTDIQPDTEVQPGTVYLIFFAL